jgi:ABC-type uncharacterized transport system substrate-binding protein
MKEIIPKLSRVNVLGASANNPGNIQQLKEIELAAEALKVKLQYLAVLSPKDIETAFQAAVNGRADAVLVIPGPIFNSWRTQSVKLAVKNRLPAIYNRFRICRRRGTYDLRRELAPLGPTRGELRR